MTEYIWIGRPTPSGPSRIYHTHESCAGNMAARERSEELIRFIEDLGMTECRNCVGRRQREETLGKAREIVSQYLDGGLDDLVRHLRAHDIETRLLLHDAHRSAPLVIYTSHPKEEA